MLKQFIPENHSIDDDNLSLTRYDKEILHMYILTRLLIDTPRSVIGPSPEVEGEVESGGRDLIEPT